MTTAKKAVYGDLRFWQKVESYVENNNYSSFSEFARTAMENEISETNE